MPDLDERIRLLKEIAEAKARFQAIAGPWQLNLKTLMESPDCDIPGTSPPELSALSKLIRQLEDELLMIDPTADVDATQEYREAMVDREQRRQEYWQGRTDYPSEESTEAINPGASPQKPSKSALSQARRQAVEEWKKRTGRTKASLYRDELGLDRAEYYRWERGELPDGSSVDRNVRRVLAN